MDAGQRRMDAAEDAPERSVCRAGRSVFFFGFTSTGGGVLDRRG
jgi:hypothetical protein